MRDLDYYRNLRRPAADVKVGDDVVITGVYTPRRIEKAIVTRADAWIGATTERGQDLLFQRATAGCGDERLGTAEQAGHDARVLTAVGKLMARGIKMSFNDFPDAHLIAMADLLAELDQTASATKEA